MFHYTPTVKECKKYLIEKKGWTFTKKCPTLHYYYWKTNGNDNWSHSKIWTMKEMRHAVERMKMKDWMDAEYEKLRQGIQLSLFNDWEYVN
jgi:hypothetical protein